jgi:hypothetical protein
MTHEAFAGAPSSSSAEAAAAAAEAVGQSSGLSRGASASLEGQGVAEGVRVLERLIHQNTQILAIFRQNVKECKVMENSQLLLVYKDNIKAALETMGVMPGTPLEEWLVSRQIAAACLWSTLVMVTSQAATLYLQHLLH